MDDSKEVIVLYSGGLDSFIAYFYAKAIGLVPSLLHIDYGQPNASQEKFACDRNELYYNQISIGGLWDLIVGRMRDHIVPSRNVLLTTLGGMIGERVWLCALEGEQLGKENDKSPAFYGMMTELLSMTNAHFTFETIVQTPFAGMTKADVVGFALRYGVNVRKLRNTVSCYRPDGNQGCGECLTCYKRYVAFFLNGIDAMNDYIHHPLHSAYAEEMNVQIPLASKMADYSRFTPRRIEEHFRLKRMLGER